MVLTYDQRLALLEKARAAKAAKRAGLNQVKEETEETEAAPKPVKTRAKKQQQPQGRTLEIPPEPTPMSDEEPEVEERIVYRPKVPKKKKIIRTIIRDPSSDEEEEEIHETIKEPPRETREQKEPRSRYQPHQSYEPPKNMCPSKLSFFNY
jgi:hypothetical protein